MAISREIYRDLATQRPEEVSEVRTCSIHFPLPALKCLIICWEVEGRKSDHAGDESRKPSIEVELINVVLALEKRDKILSPSKLLCPPCLRPGKTCGHGCTNCYLP